jgi:hypothetical protein
MIRKTHAGRKRGNTGSRATHGLGQERQKTKKPPEGGF